MTTPTPSRDDLSVPELHRLKVDVKPMSDLLSGNKTCEIRRDDRGFEVGDHVHLTCSDGRETDRIISHIQRGYGLPGGLCVLSYRADLAAPSAPVEVAGLVDYDAGLLNDYGGGDTDWWMDYLRAEIGRANEFWRVQVESLHAASAAKDAEIAKQTARAGNLARFEESHRNQANEQFHRANRKQARAARAEAALADERANADALATELDHCKPWVLACPGVPHFRLLSIGDALAAHNKRREV